MTAGPTAEGIDAQMELFKKINGTITDENGQPISGAYAVLYVSTQPSVYKKGGFAAAFFTYADKALSRLPIMISAGGGRRSIATADG